MNFRKKLSLTLGAAILSASTLQADELRLHIGYWPGDLEPELEDRLFLDDLLEGNSINRLNLPWVDKHSDTVFPLGLSYAKQVGPGNVVLAGNYARYQPEYKYQGLVLPGGISGISLVSLDDYKTTDWEGDVGYEFEVAPKRLMVKPKIGYRRHFQEFNYNETTFGNTITFSLDSPFYGTAGGLYIGGDIKITLADKVHLIGEYVTSSPVGGSFTGEMSYNRQIIGAVGNNLLINFQDAHSGYEIDVTRSALGIEYDISDDLHINAGFRNERIDATYPGHYSIPIIVTVGQSQISAATNFGSSFVDEFLTDYIFWNQKQTSEKTGVFFGLTYDIGM